MKQTKHLQRWRCGCFPLSGSLLENHGDSDSVILMPATKQSFLPGARPTFESWDNNMNSRDKVTVI
jgi:hypothetical protein